MNVCLFVQLIGTHVVPGKVRRSSSKIEIGKAYSWLYGMCETTYSLVLSRNAFSFPSSSSVRLTVNSILKAPWGDTAISITDCAPEAARLYNTARVMSPPKRKKIIFTGGLFFVRGEPRH